MSLDGSRPPHHKLTFVRALEVRNQVIGWPRKRGDSNGGGTLVQFP